MPFVCGCRSGARRCSADNAAQATSNACLPLGFLSLAANRSVNCEPLSVRICVGLVFLGVDLAAQVAAIILTPSDLQRWLGRSYFGRDGGVIFSGKRDDMFPKGDWKAEKMRLTKSLPNSRKQSVKQNPRRSNEMIREIVN
jgi:hypothetical protein